MMFFVQSLCTYIPKNKAWKELCDYVGQYKDVLIKDECSLDALIEEIRAKINQINAAHPKLKQIRFSSGLSKRIDATVDKSGCPDTIFFMDICKVRSIYQFSGKGGSDESGLCGRRLPQ